MSKEEQQGNCPAPGDWGSMVVPDAEPTAVADVTDGGNEPVRIEPTTVKVEKSGK